ncbi:hypothetical protein C8P64_0626 [Christiangramia gaetbulicola]|uniref:Peptidase M50B-like protein n=2 Tax=Christiangramia gaetbulicola TaxID=703340 RepID=A0A2T6ALE1_9FLAO|nr:hypothetical protein C8P64_0626 [Christiangramia gaetbulicola]
MLFTVIGTISHEYGHIIPAQIAGYDTTLHFGSMSTDQSALIKELDTIYAHHTYEIENDLPYEQQEKFDKLMQKLYSDSFWITIGGPLSTILTGCVGLLILINRRKSIRKFGMKFMDWLAVFLSLFWLREVFNLLHAVGYTVIYGGDNYFGGDEMYISEYYFLHPGVVPIILALIGAGVGIFVICNIMPRKFRTEFILSGIIGGPVGFYLWFEILGPILIP